MSNLDRFIDAIGDFRQAVDRLHNLQAERKAALEAGRVMHPTAEETVTIATMECALATMEAAKEGKEVLQ